MLVADPDVGLGAHARAPGPVGLCTTHAEPSRLLTINSQEVKNYRYKTWLQCSDFIYIHQVTRKCLNKLILELLKLTFSFREGYDGKVFFFTWTKLHSALKSSTQVEARRRGITNDVIRKASQIWRETVIYCVFDLFSDTCYTTWFQNYQVDSKVAFCNFKSLVMILSNAPIVC